MAHDLLVKYVVVPLATLAVDARGVPYHRRGVNHSAESAGLTGIRLLLFDGPRCMLGVPVVEASKGTTDGCTVIVELLVLLP